MTTNSKISALLEEQLGQAKYQDLISNPSPAEYLAAGEKLSLSPLQDHLDSVDQIHLTEKQKAEYIRGITDAWLKEPEGTIDEIAKEVYDKRKLIKSSFTLAEALRKDKFNELNSLDLRNSTLLVKSAVVALAIIPYAEDFDNKIIPICADDSKTAKERLNAVKDLLLWAKIIQKDAENMAEGFKNVNVSFRAIMLDQKSESTDTYRASTSPSLAIQNLAPDDSFLSWPLRWASNIPGSFSARLKIGGLLAVGTPEAKIIGLVVSAAAARMEEMASSTVNPQAPNLQELLKIFSEYSTEFKKYWTFTSDDGLEILKWLEDGADVAAYPPYLKEALEGSGEKYVKMAKYLRGYYKGLGNVSEILQALENC